MSAKSSDKKNSTNLKSLTKIKIALVGNPNSGKTTLFNALTGLNQKIGNFPGITVDKKSGFCLLNESKSSEIIDLPGAYSLYAKSEDEKITSRIVCSSGENEHPDVIVIVVDAGNLKRNLLLATQVIDLGNPCVLALNMVDEAEEKKIKIDVSKLSNTLGIKVIPLIARKGKGITELKRVLTQPVESLVPAFTHFDKKSNYDGEEDPSIHHETIERYKLISEIIEKSVSREIVDIKNTLTYKLDQVLTHKYWGFAIFLAILFLMFQAIFSFSNYPMGWIETGFAFLSTQIENGLPPGILNDLIVNGILAGLSGTVVFIPQIAFLFAFIAILEDTGYMARVSFIMDRLMKKFGLNGKSVIPLISGAACAVPAIMSARTISNRKERLITILVTPLMSCSARLPVYALLISLVIPETKLLGILNMQGLTLMGLYLIGFVAAILSALLFKFLIKSNERSYFILEMPTYRSPRWNNIGLTIWEKVKVFVVEAGKIIIAISVVLWVLSSFAPGDAFKEIENKYSLEQVGNISETKAKIAAEKLEASYAGMLGKAIEPAIKPLGFDWKIGISLITSFAAREVFVGTMATIYSVGDPENESSIREKMKTEKNPETGLPKYSLPVGLSLMMFYAFAMQCMSTIAVVYRETKHWKWPVLQFIYLGILAYVSSFVIFNFLN